MSFDELARTARWAAIGQVTSVRTRERNAGLFEGYATGEAVVSLDHTLVGVRPGRARFALIDWHLFYTDTPPFGSGAQPILGEVFVTYSRGGALHTVSAACVMGLPWPAGLKPASAGSSSARRLGIPPPD